MKLTDTEKREILKLLDADRPLPDKYRFLLFDDKREVELIWNGKTNEVTNIVLPFQTIEQVDEPRAQKPGDTAPQFDLFDTRGRQKSGWSNKLIWGDNKLILSSLKNGPLRDQIEQAGGLKLIYIDPPFDVGADFSMDIEIGDETFTKKPNVLEEIAYRDTWGKGADSFIAMIYERLVLMRDLLADDGSIYIHIGSKVSHLLRVAIEEVFGTENSRGEIVWKRTSAHGNVTNNFGQIHDAVLFFTKGSKWIWNQQYSKYTKEYLELFFDQVDADGRRYARRDLTASMSRASSGQIYTWKGITPTNSRCWAMTKENMDKLDAEGKIHWPKGEGGIPRLKYYENEAPGIPLQDIWDDVGAMHNLSSERLDYPTQKPTSLIERIISTSSNENDLVADFFCGSGTTLSVAEKLGRKWIGSDLGKFAIHTTRKRMIGVQRQHKEEGKDFRAFEILNLGKYERAHYIGVNLSLREEERQLQLAQKEKGFIALILKGFKARTVDNFQCFHWK